MAINYIQFIYIFKAFYFSLSIFKFVFILCRTWDTWTSAVRGACLKKVRSVMSQNPVLENLSERFVSWVRIKALWRPVIRMKQNSRRSNRICFNLLHFTAIICTIYKTAERKVDLTNITSNLMNWLWDFFPLFSVRATESVSKDHKMF